MKDILTDQNSISTSLPAKEIENDGKVVLEIEPIKLKLRYGYKITRISIDYEKIPEDEEGVLQINKIN